MSILRVKFRRTTLIMIGLAAFLAGLGLARTKIQVEIWWVWLSLVIVLVSIRRKQTFAAVSIIFLGLIVGAWRGNSYMRPLVLYQELSNRPVIVQGKVDSDGIYGDKSQLSFDLNHLRVVEPISTTLVGKIGVKGFGEPMVYRGDMIQVEGKLYSTRGSRQGSIGFAQIKVLEKSTSPIESTRRKFQAGMQSALPEPLASFGLGLLIGQRNTLPGTVTLQLAAVGLTHVVAVSGYNLTIIVRGVRRLLKKRSKYQSTAISILLIGLFLLFTGFSASIVRAAIVSGLSLWAWYYGRTFRPVLLLLLAAAITAGFYPLYLWSDIGWYLSFLAFFGVLVIAPLLIKRIYKKKQPNLLAGLLFESLAAQLMTMPIIMYIFGQFSAIALVANVLIVPLVPFGMALSVLAGIAGMLFAPIAGWFAWPARILLTYMLDIVSLIAKLPHASVQQNLGLTQMITLYSIVLGVVLALWYKTKQKNGIITDTEAEDNEEFI